MSDPRTDFFTSGGSDASPTASQDARTAFFASGGQSATPSPPTVYDAAEFKRRVGRDPNPAELANFKQFKGAGWAGDPAQGRFTAGQAALGGAEDALSLATGTILGVPAAAGGYLYGLTGANGSTSLTAAQNARNAVTYQPRSEAGRAGMETIGQIKPGEIVPRLLDVTGHPQAADTVREVEERIGDVAPLAGEAAAGFPGTRAVGKRVFSPIQDVEGAPTAGEVAANTVRNSPQSMGAAAASPRLSNASPQLQQAIVNAAQKTGGAVNPDALARHVEADTLPVPIRLTEGEALGDVTKISNERNSAGLAAFYNKRNGQLKENIQAIRDEVGPDVFSRNEVEHGDTLIKSYQDKAAAADADTAAKYKAFADSTGGTIDQSGLLARLEARFRKEKIWNQDGVQKVMKNLSDVAENPNMTADELEAHQTALARTIRSTADGHESYAAGIAKQELYNTPVADAATAAQKQLGINARNAARAQFQALDADPAYKAAVNVTVSPDQFVRKFVTGGTRDNVALMKQNLAHDPVAQQTMGVAAVDYLRDAARVNPDGTGNFSQAGYNKAARALDPKIRSLVSPDHAETLEQLGNVARYTQEQPAGNFINNSKTFVAAAAEHGAGLVEGLANAKAGGLPVGTMGRSFLDKRAQKAAIKRITSPGAGLDVLETKP